MLKFLEGRPQEQEPKRSPIKYQPQMCYGNSFQSPSQFQTSSTIYYRPSYVNPFLPFQNNRAEQISLQPRWTRKTNLSMIQEHKTLKSNQEKHYDRNRSRYLDSYHKEFNKDKGRFKLNRGQFTDYIEKNNHYKSIGPLQGTERSFERIEKTKKNVWVQQPSKQSQMTSALRYASSMATTVRSSCTKNSELINERIRIRRNREHLQKMYRKQIEHNKKEGLTYQNFDLPNKGVQHQIYFLQSETEPLSQLPERNELLELQRFDSRLSAKLQ